MKLVPSVKGLAARATWNGKFRAEMEDTKCPFENEYTTQSQRVITFAAAGRLLLDKGVAVVFSSGTRLVDVPIL